VLRRHGQHPRVRNDRDSRRRSDTALHLPGTIGTLFGVIATRALPRCRRDPQARLETWPLPPRPGHRNVKQCLPNRLCQQRPYNDNLRSLSRAISNAFRGKDGPAVRRECQADGLPVRRTQRRGGSVRVGYGLQLWSVGSAGFSVGLADFAWEVGERAALRLREEAPARAAGASDV
jgi:hypothetical protein